jgi:hypothetical protein
VSDIQTTADLLREVRDQADEQNTSAKSDLAILNALTRGQRIGCGVLARRLPDVLRAEEEIDLVGGTEDYDLPDDCFEHRVLELTLSVGTNYVPVEIVSASELTRFRSTARTSIPLAAAVVGSSLRVAPVPTGSYDGTVAYCQRRLPLVLPEGRVTAYDTASTPYIVVDPDERADDSTATMSSEQDRLESYISVINWRTGAVRAAFQVASITNDRVSLASTPLRSSVRGQTISGSSALATCGIEKDDYLCLTGGTCVPFFQDSLLNYLVAYATSELRRSLDGQAQLEKAVEKEAEEALQLQWSARPGQARVRARASAWPTWSARRWPLEQSS